MCDVKKEEEGRGMLQICSDKMCDGPSAPLIMHLVQFGGCCDGQVKGCLMQFSSLDFHHVRYISRCARRGTF